MKASSEEEGCGLCCGASRPTEEITPIYRAQADNNNVFSHFSAKGFVANCATSVVLGEAQLYC